jgi:uncharacterized protein (TIGR02268 family)
MTSGRPEVTPLASPECVLRAPSGVVSDFAEDGSGHARLVTPEVMRSPSLPHRAAVMALLAWSCVAVAQPPVARVRREQQLALSEQSAGGELELRLARRVLSTVLFDAEVVSAKLKGVDAERLVRLEVFARSVLLESLQELATRDELKLEVLLGSAPVPTQLVFVLVSHPTEVDTRVDLELRPRSNRPAPEPETESPRREGAPSSRFPVTGMMKRLGLSGSDFQGRSIGAGVRVKWTWDYRVAHRRLLVLDVLNPEGARPWFAVEVMHVSPLGEVLAGGGGWTVHMEAPIEPGSRGEVVVMAPEVERDAPVRLEVREKGGSRVIRIAESR